MRTHYGPLSFEVPAGFADQSTISLIKGIEFKEGKAVDAEGFPLSITVARDEVGNAPRPELYLQHKITQLRTRLAQFELSFLEEGEVGDHPAARAQFSFVAQFKLLQLVLVWFVGEELIAVTLTTTEPGIDVGWQTLEQFSATVELA